MSFRPRGVLPWCTAALLLAGCEPTPSEPSVDEPGGEVLPCLCTPPPPPVEAPGESVTSSQARVLAPGATAEEVAALVAGNTDFGAALHRLGKPGENFFFSPYSITQALAQVYAGARGDTETQMGRALRFPLSQERLHPAMNALDLSLQTRSGGALPEGTTPPTFRVVNATWAQRGMVFEPGFLDVLARHYGSGMRVVDFPSEASSVRERINRWVGAQTEQRIQELLPPSAVGPDTLLMFVNALYFKGAWASPFRKSATRDESFHALDGAARPVPMMRGASGQFMAGEGYEAVSLSYVGGDFRMLVIVPQAGRFAEVESRLSSDFLQEVRGRLANRSLDIHLPRFQLETTLPLIPALQSLGIEDAFGGRANFSGMARGLELSISSASHKAFVSVNEEGTEAAAATEVGMGPPSIPEPFLVDRPFLFVLEHTGSRTVLFLGRYVSP